MIFFNILMYLSLGLLIGFALYVTKRFIDIFVTIFGVKEFKYWIK